MPNRTYGKISAVEAHSPAGEAGLMVGDELVSINGRPVSDVLECCYLCSEEKLRIRVRRGGEILAFKIVKDEMDDLGLEFEEELFDGMRSCRNNCVFCFLQQMPKGMRKSLYMRDDDYRLSFAQGNYITLTNLSDDDMDRIVTQKMSPLHISVHTTDPELRLRMMRSPNAARVMDQLRAFANARITMHTQIVLCPGINDGSHLARSVLEMSDLYPRIESIAIVPVGLTGHREGLAPLTTVDSELAGRVVDSCERWQREFRRKLGSRLVHASDEFHLLAGRVLPSRATYEGFPQLENGVGISRIFMDDLMRVERSVAERTLHPGRYILVTGTLASPMVERLAQALVDVGRVSASVCTVKNKFFGETVTVAGLLTGQDVAEALCDVEPYEHVLIPDVMLNAGRFLDDMTIPELQAVVGAQVITVPPTPRGVFEALKERPTRRVSRTTQNKR